MTDNRIKVSVVEYPDRKCLMMRYVDPFTGRQVARTSGKSSRRGAEKLAAKWEAELHEGRYQHHTNVSWAAFREKYESEVLPSLAARTGAMIGTVFNAIERILRPKRLHDLTADRLSYFQAKLREGGRAEPTIRTYLAHLASALRWAVSIGLLSHAPKIQRPKRARASKLMKGRPITAEEFDRMLAKTESIVGADSGESWRHFLRGLWWSGLRLSESLELYWDREDRLRVDLAGNRPMLRIPAALEKGNQDRLLPMAPEFADFLMLVPAADRYGQVFRPHGLRIKNARVDEDWASRVITRIGKAGGIKVNTHPKTGTVKYASAHDLRRSFGERWARRVMPQVLMELMRHESIETTMKYYVGRNAQLTADALWSAYEQHAGRNAVRPCATPTSSDDSSNRQGG